MVRLTEPSCRLWCTSCIWVCCCPLFPLHEWKLCFWRCYPVPCCLSMSYVVFGFLWIVFWTSWRCADDNSWKQPLWTNSVDQNGSITWKALPSTCVFAVWTNLYPVHSTPICSCVCVCFYLVCFLWMSEKQVDFCTWDDNTNIEATTVWRQCEDIWID